MANITKQWLVGTGQVTIEYDGQGDGTIVVTSDANDLYEARSMQVTVRTTDGSKSMLINIVQAARQRIDLSNAVVTAANQTYNGSAKTPTATVTLNGSTVPSTGYDVSYSNNTNAGTATITITGKGDYTGTAYGSFIINKAAPSYTAPSTRSLTYSGSSQYLTTSGSTSHGTIYYSTDGINWYTSRRTGTNAGSYSCYWKLIGDSNHNDVSSTYLGTTTIAKASRSIYWSSYPSTLNEGDSGSLSTYVSAGSGDGSISFSSSNSNVASISGSTVYGVGEGSCYIYASVSEGTNYLSASTYYSLSVYGLDYVDLGLPSGRLWAKCNLGASNPEEIGYYFSWANIDGHYESDGYNWGTTNSDVYNGTPGHQQQSNISPTDSAHDAAYYMLGSPWHMPTADDVAELYDNTDKQKTTYNGVSGWKFMKPSNHNVFIFIPFAGNGWGTGITDKGTRFGCWTSNQYSEAKGNDLFANTSSVYRSDRTDKYRGYNIRAVR